MPNYIITCHTIFPAGHSGTSSLSIHALTSGQGSQVRSQQLGSSTGAEKNNTGKIWKLNSVCCGYLFLCNKPSRINHLGAMDCYPLDFLWANCAKLEGSQLGSLSSYSQMGLEKLSKSLRDWYAGWFLYCMSGTSVGMLGRAMGWRCICPHTGSSTWWKPEFPHNATVLGVLGILTCQLASPHSESFKRTRKSCRSFLWSSSEVTQHHFCHMLPVTNVGYKSSPHSAWGTPWGYEYQKAWSSKEEREASLERSKRKKGEGYWKCKRFL